MSDLEQKCVEQYKSGFSTHQIGAEYNLNPNSVRRILIKNKVKIRNKSEAQAMALKLRPELHPTKGRSRTQEEKEKISSANGAAWDNKSESKKQKFSEDSKARWKKLDDADKKSRRSKSVKGIQDTSRTGSKIENFLYESLIKDGWECEHGKSDLLENTKMHIDIYLTEHRICIEVDGPTHFSEIFGKEVLEKTQKADIEKNGLLISKGYKILRIQQKFNKATLYKCNNAYKILLGAIKKLLDNKEMYLLVEAK